MKDKYRHTELGAFFFTITFTVAIYALFLSNILPEQWQLPPSISPIGLLLVVFFASLALTRFFACLFLYLKPFEYVQWTLLMITIGTTALSYTLFTASPQELTLMKIERSQFELEIKNNGDALLIRTQTLIPSEQLSMVPEMDFYSAGGLSKDNFRIEIYKLDGEKGQERIPSTIEDFRLGRFVNTIAEGHMLNKGQRYRRITYLKAPRSFTDQVADEFRLLVSYPIDYLECSILFEEPCSVKVDKLALLQIKRGGKVLSSPEIIPILIKDSHHINFFRQFLYIGDEYSVTWEYWVPPTVPRDIP
jgi:hypothetical protein